MGKLFRERCYHPNNRGFDEFYGFTSGHWGHYFSPPLYDKSKERVAKSHYFVKDFKPLSLGTLRLDKGRGTLKLDALDIKGKRVIDVHSLDLILQ